MLFFQAPNQSSTSFRSCVRAARINVSTDSHSKLADAVRSSVTSEFGIGPDVRIWPRRTIPTTTSGKVCRQEAKRLFLADALQVATA